MTDSERGFHYTDAFGNEMVGIIEQMRNAPIDYPTLYDFDTEQLAAYGDPANYNVIVKSSIAPFYKQKCFNFILPNIQLRVIVRMDGTQRLIIEKMEKYNSLYGHAEVIEDSYSISCIHTAVQKISIEEFNEAHETIEDARDFIKGSLNIKSTENLNEIILSNEEKFKAMCSWAQGIAEAGMDAFVLQSHLDQYLNQMYPITTPLLRFLAKHNEDFMLRYIDYIEDNMMYEGVLSESFLISNLKIILDIYMPSKTLYLHSRKSLISKISIPIAKRLFELIPNNFFLNETKFRMIGIYLNHLYGEKFFFCCYGSIIVNGKKIENLIGFKTWLSGNERVLRYTYIYNSNEYSVEGIILTKINHIGCPTIFSIIPYSEELIPTSVAINGVEYVKPCKRMVRHTVTRPGHDESQRILIIDLDTSNKDSKFVFGLGMDEDLKCVCNYFMSGEVENIDLERNGRNEMIVRLKVLLDES